MRSRAPRFDDAYFQRNMLTGEGKVEPQLCRLSNILKNMMIKLFPREHRLCYAIRFSYQGQRSRSYMPIFSAGGVVG